MLVCLECNKEIKNYIALGLHLTKIHNINAKIYYDKYIRKENEGICPVCSKETGFQGIRLGYLQYCSSKCAQNSELTKQKLKNTFLEKYGVENPYQAEEIKEKIKNKMLENTGYEYNLQNPNTIKRAKQTKLEKYGNENYNNSEKAKQTCLEKYNETSYSKTDEFKTMIRDTNDFKLISKKGLETNKINIENQKSLGYVTIQELLYEYGQSWYKNRIVPILYKYGTGFITLEDKQKVEDYYNSNNGHSSQEESIIYDIIKSYYNGLIIRGTTKIITPYELDFYIPELKLSIEYNGSYWHSTKRKEKDYHYNKSILCFNKGIRLIHIYEFEDLDYISEFLKNVFNNTEKLTNDFNKFSPLQFSYNKVEFSKETIIYNDSYLEIYGSGTFNLL